MNRFLRCAVMLSMAMLLAACGGGTVGGTVSGLPAGESVTLQNNGTDDLVISTNGSFEFDDTVEDGDTYSVTVSAQPQSATCTVGNSSGTIKDNDSVTNVTVTCTATSTISGTVSGLLAGRVFSLINSGTSGTGTAAPLGVALNGPFAFPGTKAAGTTYDVTVLAQPSDQTCNVVSGGSGTVVANTPTAVTITCN